MMTEKLLPIHRALVRRTFREITGDHQRLSALVFSKLFEMDNSLRQVFGADLPQQQRKFIHMLALLVSVIDEPDKLAEISAALGTRHQAYGVRREHYELMVEAIVWALEMSLGAAFTPPVRESWQRFLQTVIEGSGCLRDDARDG